MENFLTAVALMINIIMIILIVDMTFAYMEPDGQIFETNRHSHRL